MALGLPTGFLEFLGPREGETLEQTVLRCFKDLRELFDGVQANFDVIGAQAALATDVEFVGCSVRGTANFANPPGVVAQPAGTAIVDDGNLSPTAHLYTVPVDGIYLVTLRHRVDNANSNVISSAEVEVNGGATFEMFVGDAQIETGTGAYGGAGGSFIVPLTAGQTLRVRLSHNDSVARNVRFWWGAFKIGRTA